MSNEQKCSNEVRIKYSLSDKQYAELVQDIKEITAEHSLGDVSLDEVINKTLNKRMIEIKMKENERLRTIERHETLKTYINQEAFKDNALVAIKTLLEPRIKERYTGVGSIHTNKQVVMNRLQSYIDSELQKHDGGLDRFMSGEIDEAVFVHMVDEENWIRKNRNAVTKKGAPMEITDPLVASAINGIKKANNHILGLKRNAGFSTRELVNYIVKQTHDPHIIKQMGLNRWMSEIKPRLDAERMGFYTTEALDDYLTKVYDTKVRELEQLRGSKMDNEMRHIVLNRPAQLMAEGRSIHFKDGKSAYDYFKIMNPDKTLYDAVIKGFDNDSAKISAAQIFGPNYRMGFRLALAEAKKIEANRVVDGDSNIARTIFESDTKLTERLFKHITEGEFQGPMNGIAVAGDIFSKITDMSKLGFAILSTSTDIPYSGAVISATTGKSFAGSMKEVALNAFDLMVSSEYRAEVANYMHMYMTEVNGHVLNTRFGDYGAMNYRQTTVRNKYLISAKRGVDYAHNKFMNWTMLQRQATSFKLANSFLLNRSLASKKGMKFAELSEAMTLQKFGVGEKEWELLQLGIEQHDFGAKPRSISAIQSDNIMNLPDSHAIFANMTSDQIREFKLNAIGGLEQWMLDLSGRGSLTPTAAYDAIRSMHDRNTLHGQAWRLAFKYKSFILSMSKLWDAADLKERGMARNTLIAKTILSASVMGIFAKSLQDIAQGRPVEYPDFSDPAVGAKQAISIMRDGFIKSGAGGYMFDLFSADYDQSFQSVTGSLAGPVIGGPIADIFKLGAAAAHTDWTKENDRTKYLRKTLVTLEKNTPSIPFTKAIINKQIFDYAHQTMNTGRRPRRKAEFFKFQPMVDE